MASWLPIRARSLYARERVIACSSYSRGRRNHRGFEGRSQIDAWLLGVVNGRDDLPLRSGRRHALQLSFYSSAKGIEYGS
jgi:hypothetical protein